MSLALEACGAGTVLGKTVKSHPGSSGKKGLSGGEWQPLGHQLTEKTKARVAF